MTLSPDVIDGLPHVEGVLNYLAPMAERPINLAYNPSPGVPRSTGEPEPHRVVIYDARPLAGRLSLDSEGLAWSSTTARSATFMTRMNCAGSITPKPSGSSPKSPAPPGYWCSTTRCVVVSGAASTGRLGRRVNRSPPSTTTIRSTPALNVSAI